MSGTDGPETQPSALEPPQIGHPVHPPGRLAQVARDVRSALAGGHRDYTQERLGRAIVLLAIPMVLEMVMESVFAVVDMFWVSHLGPDAIAIVGVTESMMSIIYAVAMGLSIAAGAVVARRIGEKDADGAAIAAVQVIGLGVVSSLVLGVMGAALASRLLTAMGASPAAIAQGGRFTS